MIWALVGSGLLALGTTFSVWPLSALGVGALWLGTKARPFLKGFVAGLPFYLWHLWWVSNVARTAGVSGPLIWLGVVFLVAFESVILALFLKLGRALGTPFAFAGAWVLGEWLRANLGELSFNWAPLWLSALGDKLLLGAVAFGGSWLLSLAIAYLGASLGAAWERRSWRSLLPSLGFLASVYALGAARPLLPLREVGELRVGVLQLGSLSPGWGEMARRYRELRASLPEGLDLLVLPESAFWGAFRYKPRALSLARELGRGSWLLLGSLDFVGRKPYNAAFLLSPEGKIVGRYDKRYLVPFGERFPYQELLPWVPQLGQGDYAKGERLEPLRAGKAELGVYICYESTFPQVARALALKGAELLVNITNDGWFGRTLGPQEHFKLGLVRAVEEGRWLVRCGKTGVSALVSPGGRVVKKLPFGTSGSFWARVPLLEGRTPYALLGDLPVLLMSLLGMAYTLAKKGGRG